VQDVCADPAPAALVEELRHLLLVPLHAEVDATRETIGRHEANSSVLSLAPALAQAAQQGRVSEEDFAAALQFLHGDSEDFDVDTLASLLPVRSKERSAERNGGR